MARKKSNAETPFMEASETTSFETGILTYARSLQISEGLFFGVRERDKTRIKIPIEVLEKGVRGQSSEDQAKNPGGSNPQTVEFAVLPQGCSSVSLEFSARILPRVMAPHACDKPRVRAAYVKLTEEYARLGGFTVLAGLYAWNIANGRFAWRNRFQVDTSKVVVSFADETIAFDPSLLSLEDVADRDEMAAALVEGDRAALDRFIDNIAQGLIAKPFVFDVAWVAEMEAGQEIFPSQEYIRKEKASKELSRVYAKLPVYFGSREIGQASMHSQKIGAALRHIDIWHDSDFHGPISVNPYGGVQESSEILRKDKNSFYDIRKNAEGILAVLESAGTASDIPGDIHFMVANLVRGGVFNTKSSEEKTKSAEVNSEPAEVRS